MYAMAMHTILASMVIEFGSQRAHGTYLSNIITPRLSFRSHGNTMHVPCLNAPEFVGMVYRQNFILRKFTILALVSIRACSKCVMYFVMALE